MIEEHLKSIEVLSSTQRFSVGNDLVLISNFKKSFNKSFETKVFTEQEIRYCNLFADSLLRFAATWAAKEAVYKAIKQLDQRPLSFKKIEITRAKVGGMPNVVIHREGIANFQISLTITHDGDYAWAVAILEIDQNNIKACIK